MRRIKVRRARAITLSLLLGLSLVGLSLMLARSPVGRAASAATFIVINTNDSGVGSLSQAILNANTQPGDDEITFDIPGAGPHEINLTSVLPDLSTNISILNDRTGDERVTVQRNSAALFRIFTVTSGATVVIAGLTVSNGFAITSTPGGAGIFNDGGTVTVRNCTVSGNNINNSSGAGAGAGILNRGTFGGSAVMTIISSTLSGNFSNRYGGGVANVNESSLSSASLMIVNSTISGNSVIFDGGGIYNYRTAGSASITMANCTLSDNNNSAGCCGNGGGITNSGGLVEVGGTVFRRGSNGENIISTGTFNSRGYNLSDDPAGGNNGTEPGGYLYLLGDKRNTNPNLGPLLDNGGLTFTHALLAGSPAIDQGKRGSDSNGQPINTDQRGEPRPIDLPNVTNAVGGDGSDIGAYEVQGGLVENTDDSGPGSLRAVIAKVGAGSTITFAANVTGAINLTSGELLINKSLTISGPGARVLTISGNHASRIFNTNFPGKIIAISGLTIANGSAPGANGGAIYNAATLTISYCTISDNSASSSSGGGIYNTGGTVTINNSTISGNMTGNGGGIHNTNNTANMTSGTLTITNSTISGNSATSAGGGINSLGTSTITNSTISGNSAGSNGGGIFNGGGTLTAVNAQNTIVALNTSASGPDVKGALTSYGYNLIGNTSGMTITGTTNGNQFNVDPKLETDGTGKPLLKNNGGPTQTIALLSGSTAIDGGASLITTDQRGFTRPVDDPTINNVGDGSDIGAFEVQPLNTPPTITAAPALSRQQGSAATASTIATVSDAETPPGNLIVTVTATPAGISVTDLVNTNGTITANVAASCSATVGANTIGLQVTDGGGATATANLTVNVTANTFSLSPTSPQNFGAGGSSGFVNVTSTGGCSWTAVSNATWIRIDSGASGPPPSTVGFTVFANIGPARTGTITIAGQTFTVTQDSGCTYTLSPTSQNFSSSGGTSSANVTAGAGCTWTAASNASFITITSGASGTGNGTVNYSVAANSATSSRNGTMTIANQTFTVTQDAAAQTPTTIQFSASLYPVGEGDGHATITVTRSGDTSNSASVNYHTIDDPAPVRCDVLNGTAYARCDYATTLDTLTFAPGETSKTFAIPIIDDSYAEGSETFTVTLSNATGGASLGSPATATVMIIDNDAVNGPNPILLSNDSGIAFFVRQHYLDFLAREPEPGEPWSAILRGCADQFNFDPANPSAGCDRIIVSGSFFGSPEFLTKGIYVIVFYRVAFNRLPEYAEFAPDLRSVTGATPAETNAKRAAFANNFVLRTEFVNTYGGMTNSTYVTTLMGRYSLNSITTPDPVNPDGTVKVTLTSAQMIAALNGATLTRAQVLRAIVQSDQVSGNLEAVNAFVASQYYGYLRRTPDTGGFNSWINYLSLHPNDFRTMVNGFVNSVEYRLRFGP